MKLLLFSDSTFDNDPSESAISTSSIEVFNITGTPVITIFDAYQYVWIEGKLVFLQLQIRYSNTASSSSFYLKAPLPFEAYIPRDLVGTPNDIVPCYDCMSLTLNSGSSLGRMYGGIVPSEPTKFRSTDMTLVNASGTDSILYFDLPYYRV
jgi:hypothetical protein